MAKQKVNIGVEAMRIMDEQNISFRQAFSVALAEQRLNDGIEKKLGKV